jgi:hypothetical protein
LPHRSKLTKRDERQVNRPVTLRETKITLNLIVSIL